MPSIYEQEIIDRARNPRFAGRAANATHEAGGVNLSCGDELKFTLRVGGDGQIEEIRHESRACAVCTASADLLAERVRGSRIGEIPPGDSESWIAELGIPLSPLRQKCALLPHHALKTVAPLEASLT